MDGIKKKRIRFPTESPSHKACHATKLLGVLRDRAEAREGKKKLKKETKERLQWIAHFLGTDCPPFVPFLLHIQRYRSDAM